MIIQWGSLGSSLARISIPNLSRLPSGRIFLSIHPPVSFSIIDSVEFAFAKSVVDSKPDKGIRARRLCGGVVEKSSWYNTVPLFRPAGCEVLLSSPIQNKEAIEAKWFPATRAGSHLNESLNLAAINNHATKTPRLIGLQVFSHTIIGYDARLFRSQASRGTLRKLKVKPLRSQVGDRSQIAFCVIGPTCLSGFQHFVSFLPGIDNAAKRIQPFQTAVMFTMCSASLEIPTCSPCAKAAESCTYKATTRITFRHHHNPSIDGFQESPEDSRAVPFPAHQVWLSTPSTREINTYHDTGFPDHVQSLQVAKTCVVVFSADSIALDREESPQETSATERPLNLPSIANLIIATSAEPLQVGEAIQIPEPPEPDTSESLYPCNVEEPPCNPLWPLRDKREVLLIQHFINHLSLWFDYCDKDRHFRTVIVQAASTHFVLLNALLAISCKHLSQTQPEKWVPGEADDYQARCLQSYIPALAHPGCGLLGRLHMILIVDRVEPVPSVDDRPYGHILDTNIFTLPESPDDPNYSLCRACLLVAIRQEIFISFVARTPPPRLAERCGITRTLEPTSDFDWAWRIITFTEDVLMFAYGPDARSIGSWENLRAYLHQWMEKRPASFNPLWQTGSDRETFPEIVFANDFHSDMSMGSDHLPFLVYLVAGQQHAIICQIMLLTHDPRMPVLGLDKAMASNAVEEEIRRLIRQICGIAHSAGEWQLATIAAGMTVAMCGHLFHEPAEQEKLLDILAKSEAHMGWSLLRQEEKLKAFWECNAEQ
ncbi:uncharacterized protein CLUP02_02339 [Colletotrichum lupini]|uniref:Arca-like protein n=1 Tax=Colletotrichum lupini TaxID=145971 RepID=A0A9Q8W9J2_9PEZI|nr:uncharacterized protein CLUP02_02339 [Colletotrichum lupini]UQC75683.1 hypothetical protein CLUP02_02339 [Colletotrichum lupini]